MGRWREREREKGRKREAEREGGREGGRRPAWEPWDRGTFIPTTEWERR